MTSVDLPQADAKVTMGNRMRFIYLQVLLYSFFPYQNGKNIRPRNFLIGQFLSSAISASISALTADLVFAPSSDLTSTSIPATAQVPTSDYDDPPTELTTSDP